MKKAVSENIINRKANAKLDYVVGCYQSAAGARFSGADRSFLDKRLYFSGLRFLNELRIYYKIENRFFAISYDLMYEARVERGERRGPETDCRFEAKLKGGMSVSGAEFFVSGADGAGDGAFAPACAERLNLPLITERIVAMDLTGVSVSYNAAERVWKICCRSLIGSTTWNLIPPLTQLIKPRQDECLRMLEFFELVSDAVLRE